MGYVFIRYVRQDKAFADQLMDDLQNAGIEVWRGAQAIGPGQDWKTAMREAIANADMFVFLSSQNAAARSKLVENDLDVALEHKVSVLPAVLDFPGFKHMPRKLYGIRWLDFRRDYAETLAELVRRLPESVHQTRPQEPQPEQTKGYIFISYAAEDIDFVVKLREFLSERGYSYWDYQESSRDYHNRFFLELEDVIREASATLSILSPNWRQSQWAMREYVFSEQVNTPVFLLRARETEATLLTADATYIDFVDQEAHGFQRLQEELERHGLI